MAAADGFVQDICICIPYVLLERLIGKRADGEKNMMNVPRHVVYVNLKEEWSARRASKK